MKATVVNLRYKMKRVLRALKLREKVTILYHGKVAGTIVPPESDNRPPVESHPFFGHIRTDKRSVRKIIKQLRQPRYHAL